MSIRVSTLHTLLLVSFEIYAARSGRHGIPSSPKSLRSEVGAHNLRKCHTAICEGYELRFLRILLRKLRKVFGFFCDVGTRICEATCASQGVSTLTNLYRMAYSDIEICVNADLYDF